jgi:hypothetical protein
VTTKKEDAILRRIVTDILQFGGVSVVGALPDARPLANELGGGWLGTPFKPCNTASLDRPLSCGSLDGKDGKTQSNQEPQFIEPPVSVALSFFFLQECPT